MSKTMKELKEKVPCLGRLAEKYPHFNYYTSQGRNFWGWINDTPIEELQEIFNPRPRLVEVNRDGFSWKRRVLVYINEQEDQYPIKAMDTNGNVNSYSHMREIPQKPKYTIEQLKEKIGEDFELID